MKTMILKKKYLMINFIVLLAVAGSLLTGCKISGKTGNHNVKSTDNVETIHAVNVTTAVKGEIKEYIELNGDIKSKNEVEVNPDVTGKLTSILVSIGDTVVKGQVVAKVDQSKAGEDYALSPVKSPINGTITSIPSQLGSTVSTQTAIVKVGTLDDLRVFVYISEKYISRIKKGNVAIVNIDSYPDINFTGEISEISPVVDPDTRMMEVRVRFNSQDTRLKSGMYSKVKIITEKKSNIVKLQSDAIVKRFSEYFVFVVDETTNTVKKQKITRGIEIDNKIEITEGLKGDEMVVIRGHSLLEDGSKIKIAEKIASLDTKDTIQ